MINSTSESLKAKKFIFHHFSFYEHLKFSAQFELNMKKVL